MIKGRDLDQTEVKCVNFHAIIQWKLEKIWLFLFDLLIMRRIREDNVKFISFMNFLQERRCKEVYKTETSAFEKAKDKPQEETC